MTAGRSAEPVRPTDNRKAWQQARRRMRLREISQAPPGRDRLLRFQPSPRRIPSPNP
jgi:hypothetical protein